ncbi:hypothetical protein ACTFIU_003955 [Dictyostelium citrinum]
MYNYKIILFLILFYNFNLINGLNTTNVDYYQIKRYENLDCTGEVMTFFVFYESLIFSSYLSIQFLCDNSNRDNITCAMVSGYPDGQKITNLENPIHISSTACSRGYKLFYEKEFDYNEKKYCVVSEYSTMSCEYRPILNFGNIKNVCFKGKFYECSTLSFKERTCGVLLNKTIYDKEPVVEIATYVCMGDIKYERSVVVHAVTIKGAIDPNIKGIYAPNLRPSNGDYSLELEGEANFNPEYYYNSSLSSSIYHQIYDISITVVFIKSTLIFLLLKIIF